MELDIDDSVINKRLRIIPDDPAEKSIPWLQNDVMKEISKPHKKVEPFPGACIKTWTENGDKIFINICHSKEICPPEDISDTKFKDILMEDVPSFIIPMAIGLEKMAKDKEDIERPTFDILINTQYFEKCMKKPHFWEFTILAILESINDKYKKNINSTKYVTLKNRKVVGSLNKFTIEDRKPKKPSDKKPLIQEIEVKHSNITRKPKITEMNNDTEKADDKKQYEKPQNYVFLKLDSHNDLIGLFYLPSSNISDITVDVGENRIVIENQKIDFIIDKYLAHHINYSHVTAAYDSKLHILQLTLPIMKN